MFFQRNIFFTFCRAPQHWCGRLGSNIWTEKDGPNMKLIQLLVHLSTEGPTCSPPKWSAAVWWVQCSGFFDSFGCLSARTGINNKRFYILLHSLFLCTAGPTGVHVERKKGLWTLKSNRMVEVSFRFFRSEWTDKFELRVRVHSKQSYSLQELRFEQHRGNGTVQKSLQLKGTGKFFALKRQVCKRTFIQTSKHRMRTSKLGSHATAADQNVL